MSLMKVNIPQNSTWKKRRQQLWDDVWNIHLRSDPETKAEKRVSDALKYWYLDGDLTPLLACPDNDEKLEALELPLIIQLCPIIDVEPFVTFLKDYCFWASENKVSYWGDSENRRDMSLIRFCVTYYLSENLHVSNDIFEYMLKELLPDEAGYITFPIALGIDKWQPKSQIALCDFSVELHMGLTNYLYGAESEFILYQHVKLALPYVKYIKDLNVGYFDKTIDTCKPTLPAPPPAPLRVTGAGQELLRACLGNGLGFKSDLQDYSGPLKHNDLEVEQQLKELIDGLAMPKEYYDLIEFIHEHKDNYVDYSEE
jgi:hypothetical protein